MVFTAFSRFSAMICSTASAPSAVGITLVAPPARVRRISIAIPPPGTWMDLKPVARSPRSWKPQAARRRTAASAALLDHHIHELSRHHDDLLGLLPVQPLLHRF